MSTESRIRMRGLNLVCINQLYELEKSCLNSLHNHVLIHKMELIIAPL